MTDPEPPPPPPPPGQVLPQLKALTELDASSNKAAGGVVRSLVSALPLAQMRQLPLSSCSLNEESFTALSTLLHCYSTVSLLAG